MLNSAGMPVASSLYSAAFAADNRPAIETTDPLDDLKDNNEFRYQYNLGYYEKNNKDISETDSIVPMQFTEWAWGYQEYGLYFYVWNGPQYQGFDLTSNQNGITIQDINTGSYHFYNISLVGVHDYQFYKFKVEINNLDYVTFANNLNVRSYSVGQIHLKDSLNGQGLANAYPFAKKYTYYGDVSTGLLMEQEDIDVLKVEVKNGTYLTESSDNGDTDVGTFAHNSLNYVYFNIPDSMLSQYGEVAEYHFSYHRVALNPILLLTGNEDISDSTIANASSPNIEELGGERSDFYSKFRWLSMNETDKYKAQWNQYGFHVMKASTDPGYYWFVPSMRIAGDANLAVSGLCWLGAIPDIWFAGWAGAYLGISHNLMQSEKEQVDNSYVDTSKAKPILVPSTSSSVSSAQLDQIITLNNLEDWAYIPDGKTFEDVWNESYVEEHLRYDSSSYVLESYDRNHHSAAENNLRNGYVVDYGGGSTETVRPIEKIDSISANASNDVQKWKLENDDDKISEFRSNYTSAKSSGKTPYIFRFSPGICYTDPVYYTQTGHEGDIAPWCVKRNDRAGTFYVGSGIYDLVSLDLTFAKDGNETIIPISANPTNINPSIPAAPADAESSWTQNWNQFLSILKKVLVVVAIVLAVVLAVYLLFKLIGFILKIRASNGHK